MERRLIRELIFVRSTQPEIDRGWRPEDAQRVAVDLGLQVTEAYVDSRAALKDLVSQRPDLMIWPVCYTLGADVEGPLLTAALDELGLPYVGPTAANVVLSSKLAFKKALVEKTAHRSPIYEIVVEPETHLNPQIGYPAVVKTEYSCNSVGVAIARHSKELIKLCERFSQQFGQRVFVERWERQREHTVAYMPSVGSEGPVAAALELEPADGQLFIDSEAKNNNKLIKFRLPEEGLARRLESATIEIAAQLGVDGHFRLDYVQNSGGALFPIEGNFLPFLTRRAPAQSYFPMAFEVAGKFSYTELVSRILAHALERCGADTEAGLLERTSL